MKNEEGIIQSHNEEWRTWRLCRGYDREGGMGIGWKGGIN